MEDVTRTVLVDREGLHLSLIEDPNKPYSIVKGHILIPPSRDMMDKSVTVDIRVRFRAYVALEFTSEGDDLFLDTERQKLTELEGEVYREVSEELLSKFKEFVSEWFSVPLGNVSCDSDPEPSHVRVHIFEDTKAITFDTQFDFLILIEDVTLTVEDLWNTLVQRRADPELETFFVNAVRKRDELKELITRYFKEKFSNSAEWLSRLAEKGIVNMEAKPSISNVMVFIISYNVPITFSFRNIDDMFVGGRFQPAFTFWEIRFTVPIPKEMGHALKKEDSQKGRLSTFFNYITLMGTEEAIMLVGSEFYVEARNLNVFEPKSLKTLINVLRRFLFKD